MDSIRMQDIHITFEEIDRAEKKAIEKTKEADIIQQAAIAEWDKTFESLMKLMESYYQSRTFQSSKMGELFRAWNSRGDVNAKTGVVYAPDVPEHMRDKPLGIPGGFNEHYIYSGDIEVSMGRVCQKCGRPKTHHRLYGYKCDNPDCAE